MQAALYFAAALLAVVGIAHSWLGERYILRRLFRRADIPKLFGNSEFTTRTLRFAWHVTSVAWWGYSAILVLLANPPAGSSAVGLVIGCTFLAHFAIVLAGSRGKHLAWVAFLILGIVVVYATRT
jgi:hypothetical protein